MGLQVGPAGRTSWTDQLDGSAGRTSWTDQFFLFEALASSYIQRFPFQLVHCCSFRVRRSPCFYPKWFWSQTISYPRKVFGRTFGILFNISFQPNHFVGSWFSASPRIYHLALPWTRNKFCHCKDKLEGDICMQ